VPYLSNKTVDQKLTEELTTDGPFLGAHSLELDIELSLKIQKRR